jgi:hypothetical protein
MTTVDEFEVRYEKGSARVLRQNEVPAALQGLASTALDGIRRVVAIGYSFGDDHINALLSDWLEAGTDRSLAVVNPGLVEVPAPMRGFGDRCELVHLGATDYLARFAAAEVDAEEVRRMLEYQVFRRERYTEEALQAFHGEMAWEKREPRNRHRCTRE